MVKLPCARDDKQDFDTIVIGPMPYIGLNHHCGGIRDHFFKFKEP